MCSECPDRRHEARSISVFDRRDFLRLSAAGLAGAVVLASTGGKAFAQESGSSSLRWEFALAAARYGVPEKLLLAMGYVNTLWEMPPPQASDYVPGDPHGRGAYGVMQLLQNPSKNTLGEAAALTGLSERGLKTIRAANVLGGAAVLAAMQGPDRPADLGRWYGAVGEYGGGDLYAQEVYRTLRSGAQATISTGERLTLAPQDVEVPALYSAQASPDYARAAWRPASRSNYTPASRGAASIDLVIIHIAQGSYSGTISWFQDPQSNVSAHYVVNRNGDIAQCVRDKDIAWHAGNWTYNRRSIGIEHAGYANQSWTTSMYRSSARLSAHLSRRYNIPPRHPSFLRHREVPGVATRCPGRYFDLQRYLRLVRSYR